MILSDAVVKRMPAYYRHLRELEKEGVRQISSRELGRRMDLTPSQIRQDIHSFGGCGRQGCGYPVTSLREHIGRVLGLGGRRRMTIVGAGNIGRAMARSASFAQNGFETVSIFDRDAAKIGRDVNGTPVQDVAELERLMQEEPAEIAVLAVPAANAQALAERLYACGVRGFWNFAPADLRLPEDAAVENVHLDESLEVLSFRLSQRARAAAEKE